jgi:hypothetical protein
MHIAVSASGGQELPTKSYCIFSLYKRTFRNAVVLSVAINFLIFRISLFWSKDLYEVCRMFFEPFGHAIDRVTMDKLSTSTSGLFKYFTRADFARFVLSNVIFSALTGIKFYRTESHPYMWLAIMITRM